MNMAFKKRLLMLPVAVALLALVGVWASGQSSTSAQPFNEMTIAVDQDCDGTVDGNAVGISGTFCAQIAVTSAAGLPPAGDDDSYNTNCNRPAGASAFVGAVEQLELQCLDAGVKTLHLVDLV